MKDSKDKQKRTSVGRVPAAAVVILSLLLAFMVLNFLGVFPPIRLPNNKRTSNPSKSGIDNLDDMPPIVVDESEFSLLHVDSAAMQSIHTVYVIPGGGSADGNYPEWTKRRVVAAHQHYMRNHQRSNSAIFLALSAGSLNAANAQEKDKRIVFECQHTIRHLLKLGVSRRIVFGDTFSWDTVTNAMTLRMFIDGVQVYRAMDEGNFIASPVDSSAPPITATASSPAVDGANPVPATPAPTAMVLKPLIIEVFISDFHADRVRAAFDWVLNLAPKVASIELRINTVNSRGIDWGSQLDYQHRIRHEAEGVNKIEENRQTIKTLAEFYAFLMLGGHQGLYKYLHSGYQKSAGAGW